MKSRSLNVGEFFCLSSFDAYNKSICNLETYFSYQHELNNTKKKVRVPKKFMSKEVKDVKVNISMNHGTRML